MTEISNVINTIEEVLADDKSFSTRSGLRFAMSAIKDALLILQKEQIAIDERDKRDVIFAEDIKALKKSVEDIEPKIKMMWPAYQIGVWLAAGIGSAMIVVLVKIFISP